MTGAKPISLSGFNRRVRIGSHRKNLIFAPCAAAMGFLLAHSAAFVLYCKKQQGCLVQFCCCNLSPRGDGNHVVMFGFLTVVGCNLSPRGDGNLNGQSLRLELLVATYPREGTETPTTMMAITKGCNLSPRGDGNPHLRPFHNRNHVATYPREGTETSHRAFVTSGLGVATYPREGTET